MADPATWGAVPKSSPEDWGATEKPPGRVPVGSLWENIKSIPGGMVQGFSDAASAAGRTAQAEMGQEIDAPGGEDVAHHLEKNITGELPRTGAYGRTVGEFLGNPGGYVGPGGPVGKVIGNTAAALGSETLGQAFAGRKGEGVARFLGGLGGGLLPSLLRMLNPSVVAPARQRALDVLEKEGIKPTLGQVTGSEAMRRAEGTLGTAVGAGGAGRREIDRIADEFTAAVNRRMGAKATRATPEVIEETRGRLGDAFERTSRDLKIRADQKYIDDISAWAQDLLKEALPNETTNRLIQQARNLAQGFVAGKPGEAAVMPGKNYQAHTRHDTPLARAIDDPDPNVGYYATRLRSILDDALERTATGRGTQEGKGMRKALADLKEARRQWYNMLVISRAVSGPGEGAAAGHISPQKLRQMLTSSDDRKIQYAAGRGDLSELAHAANEILAPIPTSQTAERALITSIPIGLGLGAERLAAGDLPGAVALAGGPFAPGLAGRTLLSKTVQGTKRGDWQPDWLVDALDALPTAKAQTLRSLILGMGQQNLPRYQEGGDAPAGQPIVVGERGPEVIVPKGDVSVVPDIDSLLRQMGSGPAPPQTDELTRALPGYEQRSPGELAMIRTQEATRPTRGRADISPEHAAQLLLAAGGMYAAPEQLLARGIAAAPKTMTGLLAALGATSATEAGEPAFNEPEPKRPSEIQKEIDGINKKLEPQRAQLDRLKANFAGGRIDKQEFERRRVPLEGVIGRGADDIKSIDAPFQRQLTAWETRKNDALTEQTKADEKRRQKLADAELTFRVKHPEATQNIIKGGTGVTGLTALLTGLLSKGKIKPTVGVMGVGGLEGAVTSNIPEWLDLGGFQPIGSEAWKKTLDQQLSLENLVKTGAEAGVHAAGAGAISYPSSFLPKIGARLGEHARNVRDYLRSPAPQPQPRPSSPAPNTGPTGSPSPSSPSPSMPVPQSPSPSRPPTIFRNGTTYELTSSGWRVQAGQPGAGRFMKNPPEWPSWLPREGE